MAEVHQQPNWDLTQLLVSEYEGLRQEIIKITELQFQITAVTVVAFGAVVSVGVQVGNATVILTFPLLSLLLGIAWLHHAHLMTRVASYIRLHIEDRVGLQNMGWEHYVARTPLPGGALAYWGSRATFPVSSTLATLTGLTLGLPSTSALSMFVTSAVVNIATITVFALWREPSPELDGSVNNPADAS